VASDAVQRLLADLSGLKCRTYLTDRAKTDFADPAFLIRINGAAESVLEIFDPADDTATEVPARSSLAAGSLHPVRFRHRSGQRFPDQPGRRRGQTGPIDNRTPAGPRGGGCPPTAPSVWDALTYEAFRQFCPTCDLRRPAIHHRPPRYNHAYTPPAIDRTRGNAIGYGHNQLFPSSVTAIAQESSTTVQAMPITPSSRNNRHLILFNVAPYHFCAPAAEVESMIMVPPVSRLPLAPPSVIGLINHRGQVYRVISLRRKLGLETGPARPQGQLILTSLPTGLTAFLVDDVVDVLPGTHLSRHPLSAHSPMDLFDAFILHNEQVLFHTTFTRLEQAREIPYPSPDLETMARMADDVRAQTPAPDRSSAEQQHRKGETSETDGMTAGAEESAHRADHPKDPGLSPAAKTTGASAAIPMARATENDPSMAISRPFRKEPAQKRAVSSTTPPAGPALRPGPDGGFDPASDRRPQFRPIAPATQEHIPSGNRVKTAPLPAIATQPEGLDPPQTGLKPHATATDKPASPADAAPSRIAAAKPESTPPEQAIEHDAPSRPSTLAINLAPPTPAPASEASREIMRVETETFTLMVERPATKTTAPSPPPSHLPPVALDEIVHHVVPGDTLWDIAARYLDDPFQYPELARLSQISNPDLIYPGDIIHIIRKER
jgi:chemotaxis signal transduction protein/LysM repeat protein